MQNRLFQNTLTQLKKDIKRVVGVIDDSESVIACSDEMWVGKTVDNIFTVFDASGEIKCIGGFSYKKIETFNKMEYLVFCEGDDEIATDVCALLGVHFLTLKQYYDEKYDRNSFVKNIIVDIMSVFSASIKENISSMFRQSEQQIEEYKSAFNENIDMLDCEITKILEQLDLDTKESEVLEERVKKNRELSTWVTSKESRIRQLLTF